MSKNQIFNPLRNELIAACLTRTDYIQASGVESNNKLVAERLQDDPLLTRKVVGSLASLVVARKPELILPVPDGGNWLAEAVSLETGIDFGLLYKHDDGSVDCLPDTREQVDAASSIIVMDDVLNRLTSVRKVMAIAGVEAKTAGVIGVFDRGPTDRDSLDVPVESILRKPIPDHLPDNDKLWRLAESA